MAARRARIHLAIGIEAGFALGALGLFLGQLLLFFVVDYRKTGQVEALEQPRGGIQRIAAGFRRPFPDGTPTGIVFHAAGRRWFVLRILGR
ncbi:MAG: hypothetical protein IPG49_14815 [Proteobacteria bacterium]|nr:hypothetical protein [Pseudomonadota bacterium]